MFVSEYIGRSLPPEISRYYDNGQLEYKRNFKEGKFDGLWEVFYENGQLLEKGKYKEGELDGPLERSNKTGKLYELNSFEDEFDDG